MHEFPGLREREPRDATVWSRLELEQREEYVRLGVQESLHRETDKERRAYLCWR